MAECKSTDLVVVIAKTIYDSILKNDPDVFIDAWDSKYPNEKLTVDGQFDFTAVATDVLEALVSLGYSLGE
jgi:hypothetical protein